MAGGKIDILVEPDVKGFGPKMEAGLRPALGVAGKLGGALGLAFAGAGIAGFGKEIIEVGNTYRTEMNSLQAVTQASGAAMEAAAAKARELGNDMDLPATSAGDAAAAMTELAKGGFTLQESMDAAKGTLQLAAAAQIEASQAATIQSQAIQAFGLTADHAATAADVLSGAANASSAEITGIAHGLQQAGTVAHQFGVSMEDTATTLAMFANAGIQGSDAGTLMKSALLALTDQGKPAQAAIEELGLTVYDAHGKFVGMSDLFDQLNLAASRMTDEQYQAATATLFGSDAMRLAGIAAQQGAEGFNRTRSAVTRAGQAAELAAAQTQGLPGAIEMVGNAWEETALGIYTSIEGPLASGLKGLAEGITGLAPTIADFSAAAVGTFADLAGSAAALGNTFSQLPPEVQHFGFALAGLAIAKHTGAIGAFSSKVESVKSGIAGFRTDIASTRGAFQELGGSISKTSAAMLVLGERIPAIGKMGDAYHGASSKLKTVAAAHREAATAARAQWIAEKDLFTAIDHLGASIGHGTAAKAASFAGTMKGSVAAAISGVKSAAGGLISMLGGPWGAAFLAAGWAVGEVSSELAKARKQQELLREATRRTAESQREMATAIVSGDTAGAIKSMTTALDEYLERQQQLAETKPGKISGALRLTWDSIASGGDVIGSARKIAADTVIAENAERVSEAFKKVGISSTEMSAAISGSDEKFAALINRFDQTTEGGRAAVAQLKHQRTEWQRINEETKNLAPGALEVSDAFSKIAESSTSAADKVKALNAVLDHMFGQEQSKDDAAAALADHIDKVSDAAANAVDSADGFGDALLKADGNLDLTQKNARGLRQELIGFRDELANVAATGGDMTEAWSQTQGALDQLAEKYGLTSQQVQDLAAAMGLVPSVIETAVNIEADPAKADLATVWAQADQLREKLGQPVEMRVADVEKATNDLSALGLKVDVINAQTGQIKVTADTEQALQNLDMVVTSTASVDQLQAGVKIDIDDQKFRLGAADVKTLTNELDGLEVSASAQLKIDELLAGKETSVEELRALSAEVADPKAKMVIDQLIADKTAALGHLNEVAQQNPTPKISANTSELKSKVGEAMNLINQIPLVRTITLKAIKVGSWLTGHADGGIAGFASGGRLPVYGPGTDRVDGILGVGSDGMPVARVDAGEWVINRRSSEKYHDVLAQINAGTFPAFATGGVIKSADEIKLLGLMGKVVQQGSGGLGFLSHSQLVIDAEKGLAETRKSIAEETVDLRKKEEAVADARKGLTKAERDAADKIADKEQALAKARESGKADKIEKAERDLAKAREDAPDKAKKAAEKIEKAEKDLNDLRDKSTNAAKRLEAAERTVVAARFKAAADMVTGVSEALQAGIGHIQKYFSVMGDFAEMVEKTRQEVSKLQMQQTMNRLQLIKSVQDLQVKEWDLQRTRAMGAVSVAQAEAELEKARRQQAKLGATSIEAMSGAMDRFRRTGIFSIEEVASSVIENSSAVKAAQWQVEVAKAQAAIDELEATHAQAAAQLQVAEATLAQNAAAEMLRLNTAALTEQARELYGLTSNQARGAAAGFGGVGKVVGGLGKIIGGILGGLAGFAAGGPLGAVAGAGMALGGLGEVVRGGFDIHNNKREMAEAWKGMSPGAKAGIVAGALGGAALSIGGGALAGRLGPDAAVGGAKLADQWMGATIGSMAYGVESKIAAMQRRQADKQSALSTAIEAQKLQLEAKKLSMQTEHASKAAALKAQLDYAQLQKQLAEASTKREAEALAKAAEVAAQRREAMLALAQRQTVQQDETNRQLAMLVEAQRAAAKKLGLIPAQWNSRCRREMHSPEGRQRQCCVRSEMNMSGASQL